MLTNAVDMTLEAQLIDGAILLTGSTEIVFADFDVTYLRRRTRRCG